MNNKPDNNNKHERRKFDDKRYGCVIVFNPLVPPVTTERLHKIRRERYLRARRLRARPEVLAEIKRQHLAAQMAVANCGERVVTVINKQQTGVV